MSVQRRANALNFSNTFLKLSLSLFLSKIVTIGEISVYGATVIDKTLESVPNDDTCTTQTCRKIAENMMTNMNNVRTPCQDFYYSACGNWDEANPAPIYIGSVAWDEQYKRTIEMDQKYAELLSTNIDRENSDALRKAARFFMSCLHTSPIESQNMNPIVDLVWKNGGWPLSDPGWNLNRTKYGIQGIHENYAKKTALSSLIAINSDYPNQYLGKPRLSIEIPELHVEQRNFVDLYGNPTWRRNYVKYITLVAKSIAKQTNSRVPDERIKRAASDVIKLEEKLFQISGNKRSSSQRPITVRELQTEWDNSIGDREEELSINWLDVINGRLEGSELRVNNDSTVIVSPANLINKLAAALRQHTVATIVDYIHWKVIRNLQRYTSKSIRQAQLKVEKDLFGPKYLKRRVPLSSCITGGLKHAIHYLYMNKTQDAKTRKIMSDMREKIREAIERDVRQENVNFDHRVTQILINELNSMVVSVDYPVWYEDLSELDKYYEKLSIGDNYFENVLAVRKFREAVTFDYLKVRQDQEISTFALLPTGYIELSDERNFATFPLGNLPPPEINPELPMAVTYAQAGSAIGREIVHLLFINLAYLFHDYSTDGTFSWADSRIAAYENRLELFVSQYEHFYPLYKGASRMEEHIPDNGGVKAAFRAYKIAESDGTIVPKTLPDFPAAPSHEHLFFYAYANNWCEYNLPYGFVKRRIDETHSWGRSRLFLPLLNMNDFLQLFNCPPRNVLDAYV